MSKRILPFMVNPRGRRSAKRRAAKTVVRRARRKSAPRSRSTRRKASVPAWVRAKGFSSWSSYMQSIRPGSGGGSMAKRRRRRSAPKARRRRRRNSPGVALAVRSNRPRRRRRRNPLGGGMIRSIPTMALQGVIGAGQVIAGKGVARLVRGKLNIEGATTTGSLVEVGVGIVGALAMRRRYPRFAERFLIGAFIAPLETIAKQANIPYLSVALGDEGTLPLIAGEDDLVNIGGEYFPRALMGGEYSPAAMAGLGEEVPIQ